MTDAQSAQNIATTYDPTEIEKEMVSNLGTTRLLQTIRSGWIILYHDSTAKRDRVALHMGHGFNNAIMDALTPLQPYDG